MPERKIPDNENITTNTAANNAVDLDITTPKGVSQGSAISIGDGILLTAAHNLYLFNTTSVSATLREEHDTEGDTDNSTRTDFHNIGQYGSGFTGNNRSDFAVITTDLKNTPTASMIVFQNPDNAAGSLVSAGYPGARPRPGARSFDGETLVETKGTLSEKSFGTSTEGYEKLSTDKDTSPTSDDALAGVQGQSGSGVSLNFSLSPLDTRLPPKNMQDMLAGTMTYGSKDTNGNVSHDATKQGASFTPITKELYSGEVDANGNVTREGISQIAEKVSTEKHLKETYEADKDARKAEVKAAGDKWRGEGNGKAQFKDEIANDPEIDRKIAKRFADNVMISDQSVKNEDAAKAIADGTPLTSTFNGAMFNETNYANQNVSMNIDMAGGYDVADYFVVGKGKGLTVEIGASEITVEKSFTTEEQVEKTVVTGGVETQQTTTEIRSHTATDRWKNTEEVRGSGSDDTFIIKDLSGVETIDGRDLPAKPDGTPYAENDTLRIDPSIGPVDWQFDTVNGVENREGGYIVQAGKKIRFDNIENVETRPGDLINGAAQSASLDTGEQDAKLDLPMKEALEILDTQQASVLETGPKSDAGQMLESGAAFAVMNTLVENKETAIAVSPIAMAGNAIDQVGEVLRAAVGRLRDKGLETEAEQNFEQLQFAARQQDLSRAAEEASHGAEI